MIPIDTTFDTNVFFSGGAGMFLQYEDLIKPVGLYVIIKMLIGNISYGLPLHLLSEMTNLSMVEWYMNRRYRNPLRCLDFLHRLDPDELDDLYQRILSEDPSIYQLSTPLNVVRMMTVYKKQHMSFPILVYHPTSDEHIEQDVTHVFDGVNVKFVTGEVEDAIPKGTQNFTYIFSDIETMKRASEVLKGTCSHVLIANDYRYNMRLGKPKYDLGEIMRTHQFIRLGTTTAVDRVELAKSLSKLYK